MSKRKPPKLKKFKGHLRIPLDTSCSLEELASRSEWVGDWAFNRKYYEITNRKKKHIWYINLYMFNIVGERTVETLTSPKKMNAKEMELLLEYALKIAEKHPMLDYDKSYLTVSA